MYIQNTGTLFVVATPIGNLQDISPRAIETLKSVQYIAAEDTRHTRKLLNAFNISTPCFSYHEHNEVKKLDDIISYLHKGFDIALVSDAGTPCISDPGYQLINTIRKEHEDIKIVGIPGPSAVILALSISGFSTSEFAFIGFLPTKTKLRQNLLRQYSGISATIVCYESPHRIIETLDDIEKYIPNRKIALARELTKLHEEMIQGTTEYIKNILLENDREKHRGEMTILISGNCIDGKNPALTNDSTTNSFSIESDHIKDIAKTVAKALNIPKSSVYKMLCNLKEEHNNKAE